MNILIHNNKGYRKTKTSTTYWYISFIKGDILNMLDNAMIKIDNLLGYKRSTYNIKFK